MTSIAPTANFNGTVQVVGRFIGLPGGQPINNLLLHSRESKNPLLVGMGNAMKVFISYNLPETVTSFTVSLYWIQRAKDRLEDALGVTFTRNAPSRDADEVIRTLDTPLGFYGGINDVAFFDVSATKVISGTPELDNIEMRWQQIVMPLTDPPVDKSILPLTSSVVPPPILRGNGVVYECIAKTDEVFFISQTEPEDAELTLLTEFIGVDVEVGANAQGEQR